MSVAAPVERDFAARPSDRHPIVELAIELVGYRVQRRLAWLEARPSGRGRALDDPSAEQRFFAEHEPLAPINARIAELEQAISESDDDPLHWMAALFEFGPDELELLIVCLAPMLEPALAELYARVQGNPDKRCATEQLAARLLGWGRRAAYRPDGGLARWGLVHAVEAGPGQSRLLLVDPQLIAWLHGDLHVDAELVTCTEPLVAQPALASWPVIAVELRVRRSLEQGHPLRFVIIGPEGCGRRSFAATVARRLGAQALAVDCDAIPEESWTETYVRLVRLALVGKLILVWHGERVDRAWPRHVGAPVLQFVICEDPSRVRAQSHVVSERLAIPNPSLDERHGLWSRLVPGAAGWSERARERLATRHRLSVGDIAEIGRRLPVDVGEAAKQAREQTRGRLGELGQLLECPFSWDDLVVTDRLREALEDFAFEASERAVFWESPEAQRLFPRGTGLVGLFTGPPGTGKTMAAQVIAAGLELDLFRINLATVVSKYIGETAKNLDKIFSRAARMNAVLLFDEADALFAKRTEIKDSHDRYANADTNYLLQLLEDYQGIALLASNKKSNIDAAFIRRVRYVFDFARPDGRQRWTIWRKLLVELLGPEILRPLEPAIAVLAETVDMSGAQIKNSLLAAIFVARRRREPLSIEHLVCGIDRELGKDGRAISDRERERLRRNG